MSIKLIDYIPVYFEASKLASPTTSGIDVFGLAYALVPFGVISGLSIAKSGRYRPQLWLAWVSLMIGLGLLSTLTAESNRASGIGYQVVMAVGLGILMTCTFFPILAPLHPSLNANAIALFMFLRFFAQVSQGLHHLAVGLSNFIVSLGMGCHNWWCHLAEPTEDETSG